MRSIVFAGALCLVGMGAAHAQGMAAQDFVNNAASGGMFEVQSSELALERSQNAGIQGFAQQMVADHTPNNEELKTIAEAEGLTVPTEIMGPMAEHMEAVQAAEGEAFDAAYAEHQVAAHETAVELYQGYAEGGDNDALKAYAEKSLPVLQKHLEDAQGLTTQ